MFIAYCQLPYHKFTTNDELNLLEHWVCGLDDSKLPATFSLFVTNNRERPRVTGIRIHTT